MSQRTLIEINHDHLSAISHGADSDWGTGDPLRPDLLKSLALPKTVRIVRPPKTYHPKYRFWVASYCS